MIERGDVSRVLHADAFFGSAVGLAANGSETVLAPASNVRGVIIQAATIVCQHGSAVTMTMLYARQSAPTALGQAGVLLVATALASGQWASANLPDEIVIPPGYGIYFFAGTTEAYGRRSVAYKVL